MSTLQSSKRGLAALIAAAIALSVVGLWAGTQIRSPSEEAARAGPPSPSVLTAEVESTRISAAVAVPGRVVAVSQTSVAVSEAHGATRLIVSKLPKRVGDSVSPGDVILEISGRPVFGLPGLIPLYRDISLGDNGTDVSNLQAALTRVGLKVGSPGVFDARTQAAVGELYRRARYRPVSAEEGTIAPLSEFVFVQSLPTTLIDLRARLGEEVEPNSTLAVLAQGIAVLTRVSPDEREGLQQGTKTTIELSGERIAGSVDFISHTLSLDRRTGVEGYLVRVSLPEADANLVDTDVTVNIEKSTGGPEVLVVPISAVYTGPDARTGVIILRSDGSQERVLVETGTSSQGLIAVQPVNGTLSEGDLVVVGMT